MDILENTATVCIQTSDWCWGVGSSIDEAIKNARGAGSSVTKSSRKVNYVVFEFDDNVKPDSVYVDGFGSCRWEVKDPEPDRNFRQGMIRQWMRKDGKESLLTD